MVAEMLSVLDEDLLETFAEAFSRRILNNEDNLIWKAPRESHHVIRYAYDPKHDKLDDFKRPRRDGSGKTLAAARRSATWPVEHEEDANNNARLMR